MPNKPKATPERNRREKVETLRREQKATERRKTWLFVGGASVLGLGILAAAVVPAVIDSMNDPSNQSISTFGVSAAAASCDPVTNDTATGSGDHVAEGTVVKYATIPPSSGQHYATPAAFSRKFYTESDRPEMERLVHNLEHGYTIVWYDDTIDGEQLQELRDLSERVPEDRENTGGKFIVSAWDDAYGAFPEGKHVSLAHWSAGQGNAAGAGHRQLCGQVSGEAIESFIKQFPYTDSPEPNAA